MVPARLKLFYPTECMSIAVSAVVRTPVCVRLLQACLGLCALMAAWPLSGCWPAAAAPMQLVGAYAWPLPLAVLSAAGGIVLLLGCCCATVCRLDISPVGQLRVAVYLKLPALKLAVSKFVAPQAPALAATVSSSLPWLLLPGSTLWPALLVLRLADGHGRQLGVLVQRGAHGCPHFRALAVACRVMAGHKGQGRQ